MPRHNRNKPKRRRKIDRRPTVDVEPKGKAKGSQPTEGSGRGGRLASAGATRQSPKPWGQHSSRALAQNPLAGRQRTSIPPPPGLHRSTAR